MRIKAERGRAATTGFDTDLSLSPIVDKIETRHCARLNKTREVNGFDLRMKLIAEDYLIQ